MKDLHAEKTGWYNSATRAVVATLGVVFGIGGLGHGIFETLQGNTPTNGLYINAIGGAQKFWAHGNEPAFTVIPNFLLTGIAAIIVSLAVIIWSAGFMHKKYGSLVFLALFILLFLVGGGIGQVIFFTLGWAVSTGINKPLTVWKKILPVSGRAVLGKLWPVTLPFSAGMILFALEIAMFGFVPGMSNPDSIVIVMLSSLGLGLLLLLLSTISGFAHDIRKQEGLI